MDGGGPRYRATLTGMGPIALAVLAAAALRFSLPAGSVYPLLSMMAAALIWFGVTRAQDLRGEPDPGDSVRAGEHPPGGRYGSGFPHRPDGPGGSSGRYRAGGRRGPGGPAYPRGAGHGGQGRPSAPPAQMPGGTPARAGGGAEGEPGARASAARPYGRILIFTLLEDKVAEFDRLAGQVAEEVSAGEPDTLVYVIHLVPDAPLQRIFYEIYRDRSAFESHESQPYMKRFVAERRSCVLATTAIELRLKYAKLAPLPSPPLQPLPQGPLQPRVPGPPDQRWPPAAGRQYGGS